MAAPHQLDAGVRALVLASATMPPDELPQRVRQVAEDAGAFDVELLVVDLAQQNLVPLLPGDQRNAYPVVGTPAGDAYRTTAVRRAPGADGTRLWLPVMDSAERVGVLGVTVVVDDDDDVEGWEALASLTGELIVAKARYGDAIGRSRRTRATTLAAEMRWSLLPPLTYRSSEISVTGILEPAYEIAGDTFDYAINGRTVHLAILDAMGHGLEASRMANVAVSSYRHSRRQGLALQEMALALDEAVQACFDRSRYVTGQLATFDVGTRRFRMLNMGHPLPLLLRDGAVVGELPSEPMLPAGWGSKPAAIYEARLEPCDQVLMFTDGITEARSGSGDQYGTDRLVDFLGRSLSTGAPPEEILREVIEDIMRFQDFHASDDATLLLLTVP
jgi:hypothetical protein